MQGWIDAISSVSSSSGDGLVLSEDIFAMSPPCISRWASPTRKGKPIIQPETRASIYHDAYGHTDYKRLRTHYAIFPEGCDNPSQIIDPNTRRSLYYNIYY